MGKVAIRRDVVLVYLVVAVALVSLLSIFGPTAYLVDQHHENAKDVRVSLDKQHPKVIVQIDNLEHEQLFLQTVKSCLPAENKKCKEFVPDATDDKKKVQRIALVAPPGDISASLANRVEEIMHLHNKRSNKKDLDIDVILTSHVPPYGYGKTHGLTKIIRLIPQPLLLEVTDSLTSLLQPGESYKLITLEDLKMALRQILRFHCRLSHVAAHTALDSIRFMDDLLYDPSKTIHQIHTFMAPNDGPPDPKDINDGDGDDDDTEMADDDQEGLMEAEMSYGSQILTYVQHRESTSRTNNLVVGVLAELDAVLVQEMKKTKNMTAWPCLSFWGADKDEADLLSPLTKRLARALSPDCDDPYNTCFVERDKCEFHGDAECKKKKKKP